MLDNQNLVRRICILKKILTQKIVLMKKVVSLQSKIFGTFKVKIN